MRHIDDIRQFESRQPGRVFYKFVKTREIAESILRNGLIPSGTPVASSFINGMSGNWAIAEKNLAEWTKPNRWFGSALQALMFFNAGGMQEVHLLRFTTGPDNEIFVRDVDLMFKSDRLYKASLTEEDLDYKVTESYITGTVPPENIQLVNRLGRIDIMFKTHVIDPGSLLDWAMGRGEWRATPKRIRMSSLVWKFITYKLRAMLGG